MESSSDTEDSASPAAIPRVSDLPGVDRDLLRALMVLKTEALEELLRNPECGVLQDGTLRFANELLTVLNENSENEELQRGEVKRLLGRFGRSWVELWKEAYKMVEKGDVDMREAYRRSMRALTVERLKREVTEREREISLEPDENRKLELANELNRLRSQVRSVSSGDGSP